ncbi:MAG: glycosyltransferase family 2 protein [Methanomicrobiaceae archaeon]|nr:glycosyltransferase family 2 protein [Methanomicrobiaceae archaeon]
MPSSPPRLSVVLPALNEEETVGECIDRIRQVCSERGIAGEIIIADSSTDRTPSIARDLGAVVVRPSRRGYGNAYLAGLAQARGELVAIGDADNTYDFLELPLLLDRMEETGADMVFGSRLRGEIREGAMPWLHQYIGNPLLTWLLNVVFRTHISDAHSGFRLIRREALERLNLKTGGMEFASEMFIEAAKAGLAIEEVPITYHPRVMPSKLHSFSDGWRHIRFMLLYKPLPFLAVPGFLFALFGLLLLLLFSFDVGIETSRLHTFILSALAFIGGLQILLMGITIKVYSVMHGFSEPGRLVSRLMTYLSLERELFVGVLLMLMGVVVGIGIVQQWIASGLGELAQVTNAVWSLALFLSGLQIVFSAIFLSMMLLNVEER